jgi:tetratricopeptide (TPR) repeat protein/tRNA A-37 threonylcarbamoyl transferase component Bud32
MSSDENLLFGVLALQADFIDPSRFAEACSAWAASKERALADLLVERGWLSAEDRADVDKLVRRKLRKHHGDAHASLLEATPDHLRHSLADVAGPPVAASEPGATTAHEAEARGRYTLTRLHAQGGIGQVWLARDEQLGRDVALKELRPERRDHAAARARFLEEARVTGQLEHPGIVPVHELVRGDDGGFYTMRLVRGRTLGEAVKEYHKKREQKEAGRLELRALLGALVAACNAVAYAHSRGVIHRDLKPANMLLGAYGEVVVLDWGLAKVLGKPAEQGESTSLLPVSVEAGSRDETVQGQVLGTPGFMAPEQAAGRLDQIGPATDVYGLGAILYQILTGRPPFEGGDTPEQLQRVAQEEPRRPRQLIPATPRALEAVCLKALAKKPADRYASASELAHEIERWLADEPVLAWREPVGVRAARWMRRRRPLVVGLATGLLVFLLLGGAFASWWRGELERQEAAVDVTLEWVEQRQKQGKTAEARALLEPARPRVGGVGTAHLHERLRQAERDLDLMERLEAIRLQRIHLVEGEIDRAGADRKYAEAFAEEGLGREGDDVREVARAVKERGAALEGALVAALDAWAADAPPQRRAWILKAARACDPRTQKGYPLRDPALWADRDELARAVAAVRGEDLPPNLVVALAARLDDHEEGERLLRQAQRARPGDFWLTHATGVVLARRKKYAQADGYLLAAVSLRPGAVLPLLYRGWVLNQLGRHAEAEEVYRQVVRLDPASGNGLAGLGEALSKQGKHDEAVPRFRDALGIEPRNAARHADLGAALARQGEHDEAEKVFRSALRLDDKLAAAHAGLGEVLSKQGEHEEAEKECLQAVRLAPDAALTRAALGYVLARQGRYAEAEGAYRKAAELDPRNANAHYNLGLALGHQGRHAEAERACLVATALDPADAAAHYNHGLTLARLGRHAEAERSFRKAVDLDPGGADARYNLGLTLERQGKWIEAGLAYQRAAQPGDLPRLLRRMAALHPELLAHLRGDARPADKDLLALARLCRFERLHAAAARGYAWAFAADEKLADDLEAAHRYDAAAQAVLSACGAGGDAPGEQERARLRRQALDWLRADLAKWKGRLAGGKTGDVATVRARMLHWLDDGDLAGVRGEKALAALPEGERKAWGELWADVAALLRRASER